MGLGMFYPWIVDRLVGTEHSAVVPITYGLSTLSSVIGASFAMTMMIPWGFNDLLYCAAGGYVALGLLIVVHSVVLKRRLIA
jgi:hypothetical protein